MADESQPDAKEISFTVKSSNDQKFSITVPESMTVADLKAKLSTSEYADLPSERQRLIYSGRVLKDTDQLSAYKIKDGNTVHMVKGAASTQRQTASSETSGASTGTVQQNPAAAGVPQNIAAGTGGDPMANLTGARYAGFAQMPGANMFGPDGGMGPPPGPDELLSMLENPMFQSQMNEAMNNPDVIRMMTNNPMIQQNPFLRNALQNPEFRRMMMDPQVIRNSMQMSRMMGGIGGQGQDSMPAPGVTDTTPQQQGGNAAGTQASQQNTSTSPAPQFNPFQFMAQGQGQGQGQNPFAALFGGMGGMGSPPAAGNTGSNATNTENSSTTPSQTSSLQSPQQQQPNPFANLFGAGASGGQQQQQADPFSSMMQTMMSNPQLMQQAMQQMQTMYGAGNQNPQGQQAPAFNPMAFLGQGGIGSPPAPQQDSRPPEEQYAEQLRQLNDMGFYEFERNVRALRMAGGSVQGAVEMLLSGS